MKSSNPALNDAALQVDPESGIYNDVMTLEGTVTKATYLLGFLLAAAVVGWRLTTQFEVNTQPILIGASVSALIVAIVTIFKKSMAPTTAPAYAILEGLALGILAVQYEALYSGIVIQAILLTLSIFGVLLFCYKSGIISPSENFKLGVISATVGIFVVYIIDFVLRFFGMNVPYIHESGQIGIIISCFIVVVAALNLVLDFDYIERGATRSLPKYMEWYAAFGLLITLVWLYIEILRLLAKLRDD